jgi:predicted  nucleic acid-binding Zn-ribbon protein
MTQNARTSLRELQRLDTEIRAAQELVEGFGPMLDDVEGPSTQLEEDVEATRKRLREIRLEERRLELSADEKRARSKRLQERMNTVRNLREEAAVHAELDLVRRTIEHDEQEALGLLDQVRKLEERLEELEAELGEAKADIEPRRQQILEEQSSAETHLEKLLADRNSFAEQIDVSERRLYESIKSGGRTVVVAELTADGACGHCFGMVPLQLQANIRTGADVIRCEACGVILAAAESGTEE